MSAESEGCLSVLFFAALGAAGAYYYFYNPVPIKETASCSLEADRTYSHASETDYKLDAYVITCMTAKGYELAPSGQSCPSSSPDYAQEPKCYRAANWLGRQFDPDRPPPSNQ